MPPCRFSAGIDASDFDWDRGPMDLGAAASDGISFFTHKATEGVNVQHVHFGTAVARARDAGIPFIGAYHVVRSTASAQAQVDYLLAYVNQVAPWWTAFPGWFWQIDYERWSYDPNIPVALDESVCDLLVAQTGRQVLDYASKGQFGDSLTVNHPLWNANYPTWHSSLGACVPAGYREAYANSGGDSGPGWAPYSGQTPVFWQFTDNAQIGSQPGCDANAYRGTADQLRQLVTGGKPMDDRLLGGWTPTVTSDGKENGRGAGVMIADQWRYLFDGKGAYEPGHADPNGPSNGLYLDALLKTTRDYAKAAADAARQSVAAPTQDQIDAAMMKALLNPDIQAGIGAAIASHLHVT